MSPVLSFTAEEAWQYLPGKGQDMPVEESIFFDRFPELDDVVVDEALSRSWDRLLAIRSEITKVLEGARREKIIGLSLDAEVLVQVNAETKEFLADKWDQLQEICIVSSLKSVDDLGAEEGISAEDAESIPEMKIGVRPAPGDKCERCWTIATSVGQDEEHPAICARCVGVVRSLNV